MKVGCIKRFFTGKSLDGNGVVRQYRRAYNAWNGTLLSGMDIGTSGHGCVQRIIAGSVYVKKMNELQAAYDAILKRAKDLREYKSPKDPRFYISQR